MGASIKTTFSLVMVSAGQEKALHGRFGRLPGAPLSRDDL
jgi:hypothetical protein